LVFEERFEVIEGELNLSIDGEESILTSGETLDVPKRLKEIELNTIIVFFSDTVQLTY
jgi:ethanolamine utilization protein EutQ (cupin superfamily)